MIFESFSISGKHNLNQDKILAPIAIGDDFLWGLADGVGGSEHGELASEIVTTAVINFLAKNKLNTFTMPIIFDAAQIELNNMMKHSVKLATTLTLCHWTRKSMTISIGHVGDCRVYHLSGQGIATRTKDQTEVQKLIDDGILPREHANKYPRKNVLLSAISSDGTFDLYQNKFVVKPEDRILIVSDGFYRQTQKTELRDSSVSYPNFSEWVHFLEKLSTERIPKDDCSLAGIEIPVP